MKRSTGYYRAMVLIIMLHTSFTCFACGQEEPRIPTVKDLFKENLGNLKNKNRIMEINRKENLEKYRQDIARLYELQLEYANSVRALVRTKKKLTKKKTEQTVFTIEKESRSKVLESQNAGLKLFDENHTDLTKSFQAEPPPAYFVHKVAYIESEVKSEHRNRYDFLSKYLRDRAEKYYTDLINIERVKSGEDIFIEYIKSIQATYAALLEHAEFALPECDQAREKQVKMLYYVSEIYAVEGGRASEQYKAAELTIENNDQYKIVSVEIGENQPGLPGITFCDEQDKSRLLEFLERVKAQKEKTKELQKGQQKLWSSFWDNKKEIINSIAKNMAEKEKIIKSLEETKKEIENIDKDIKRLKDEENEILDKMNDLEKGIKKAELKYLSAMADRKLDIVLEGKGNSEEEALMNLLKEGEKMSNMRFRQITMELYGSFPTKEKSWTENIKNKLISFKPLGWLRGEGGEFNTAATLTYRINIPKELVPIRDYQANLRSEFIESIQGQSGEIHKDKLVEKEWWHVGFSDFGYVYEEALAFLDQNGGGWSLPGREELASIRSQEPGQISVIPGVKGNNPYWTRDIAKNGNPYGFCFGSKGNCNKVLSGNSMDYPKNDGLAVILIRYKSKKEPTASGPGN
jgi:hypothetical protein